MANRTFIIGAGLGSEYGLPLAGRLTDLVVDEIGNDHLDSYIWFLQRLQVFFPHYRKGLTPPPSLFEFVYLVKSYDTLAKYLKADSDLPAPSNWTAFFGLLKRALAKNFRNSLQKIKSDNDLSSLIKFCEQLRTDDVIITFNWDCLLEIVLEMLGMNWTTKVSFSNDADLASEDCLRILKLHGSVDWIRKPPLINNDLFFNHWTLAINNSNSFCRPKSYAQSDLATISEGDYPGIHIPGEDLPLLEFREIWQTAFKLLDKTKEAIFIGYSMPQYDVFAKHMFLSTLAKNNVMGHQIPITIINPNPSLKQMYEEVLHQSVRYHDATFAQWVASTAFSNEYVNA